MESSVFTEMESLTCCPPLLLPDSDLRSDSSHIRPSHAQPPLVKEPPKCRKHKVSLCAHDGAIEIFPEIICNKLLLLLKQLLANMIQLKQLLA